MTKTHGKHQLLLLGRRGTYLFLAVMMSVATTLAAFRPETASAAQLTPRKVTISSSASAATGVSYAFEFTSLTDEIMQGMIIDFCTTPLGTCTQPPSMDLSTATVTAQTGWVQGSWADYAGAASNDCTLAATQVCLTRTAGTAEVAATFTITVGSITNPTLSGVWMTVYPRIFIYDNASFNSGGTGSPNVVHYGTVAAGIVNQLETTGRVQERLEFCVMAIDDSVISSSLPADCNAFLSQTVIDLGIIDHTSVKASPVDNSITDPANDRYGILNVNTNASSGVVVSYFPEELSGADILNSDTDQLRSFRVIPTDCGTAGSYVDQCFEDADRTSATGEIITAGTELFGLAVACINVEDPVGGGGVGLTNSFDPAGATGGTVNTSYDGDGDLTDDGVGVGDCENEDTSAYSWAFGFDGSTPDELVTSATVVDNEIIKLRFGAAASPTTPTGSYSVTTTYIATPTF